MNKYARAALCLPYGSFKMCWTKLFHMTCFKGPLVSLVSPLSEITLDRGGVLEIGRNFRMRDGAKVRVRKGAVCRIGDNSSMNSNSMVVCHEHIEIGDDVQLAPNVQIYDHDHDYRAEGGVKAGKFRTKPVKIGNNVWIGANTVILCGTVLGDNCVVGAGSILKGEYPEGSVIIQKRATNLLGVRGGVRSCLLLVTFSALQCADMKYILRIVMLM